MRTVHFHLPPAETYTLKGFGGSYSLASHSEESLRDFPDALTRTGQKPTHFSQVADPSPETIQLVRVYGENDSNGVPTLTSIALVNSASSQNVYDSTDLATALIFLHPDVSVLTSTAATTVVSQIQGTKNFGELPYLLDTLNKSNTPWNTSSFPLDSNGNQIPNPYITGTSQSMYQYDLCSQVENARHLVSGQAIVAVNNASELEGIRYSVVDGVPYQQPTTSSSLSQAAGIADTRERIFSLQDDSGYTLQLQDPGPNFGISAQASASVSGSTTTLTVTLNNNYVRDCSCFVSFLEPDGVTAITLTDSTWESLANQAVWDAYNDWSGLLQDAIAARNMLFDATNQLKYLGTLSSETTFLGVPVDSGSNSYSFQLPSAGQGGPVGKIRVLVGSLGQPSGNDWDPRAAVVGICMTSFFELILPTFSLVMTVGTTSSNLLSGLKEKVAFFGPIVINIATTIYSIIENPSAAASDVTSLLLGIADSLMQNILGAADVAAQLTAVFGAEELAEAVPIVGWALKAEAAEATIEQLAQTVGEVVGSNRVTEFDITITMDIQFTLVPVDNSGFASTATSFTITAQYSDVTGYVYDGTIPDPNVSQITSTWTGMPVGGTVSFLVALYSKEGHLVGKGQSAQVDNVISAGESALVVPQIAITQVLYPLTSQTTYQHQQLLEYTNGAHSWTETSTAPTETAKNLSTGTGGNNLATLSGITLNSDSGVVGYAWQASGQNIPIIGTTSPLDLQVYTFQNMSFTPTAESALMFVAAGYSDSPRLIYLRSVATQDNGGVVSAAANSFFFLDPVPDSNGNCHLRGITPVTDSTVPPSSSERIFDQSTTYSWGCFPNSLLPTSLAIHSDGTVVGVASGYNKLMILELSDAAVLSSAAPWAQVLSGTGTRAGLLNLPELVAIAPNQTIYVLEAGNLRVQTFSRGGHPVPTFSPGNSGVLVYSFPLYTEESDPTTITYTAMSVEIKGYIYILSYEENGYTANQFRLDLYTPQGDHLFRQRGVNVAALTVDLWRNLYTQNYQTLLGPGNRTEPSISEWIPSTPA